MNPMKRVGLVALVFLVGAFLAASEAFAQKYTYALVPPAIDPPERDASGKVTDAKKWDRNTGTTTGEATVSCGGLTPLNQYHVVFYIRSVISWGEGYVESYEYVTQPVESHKNGRLTTQWSYTASWWSFYGSGGASILNVWVGNDLGNVVLERAP